MEEERREEFFQTPSQFETRTTKQDAPSGKKRYIVIIILIVVIGLIIFGVTRFFTGGSNNEADTDVTPTEVFFPTDTPTPTEDVTPTPDEEEDTDKEETPTPKPTSSPIDKSTGLDRSKLSIHVLNGSGVAGASKEASDYLESLGYNVVQIGNADNFDYTETEIQIKKSDDDFIPLLKKDLEGNDYTVGSSSETPASDETADAVVIIGAE